MWPILVDSLKKNLDGRASTSITRRRSFVDYPIDCARELLAALDSWQLGVEDFRLIIAGEGIPGVAAAAVMHGTSNARLHEAFAAGASIVLLGVDRISQQVAGARADMARATRARVHVNAYFSPPHSLGAGRHADEHAVIVLQLHGSKHWTIFRSRSARRIALHAGDTLFIRSGLEHAVHTSSESSLHLTFGIGGSSKQFLPSAMHRTVVAGSFLQVARLFDMGETAKIDVMFGGNDCAVLLAQYAGQCGLRLPAFVSHIRELQREEIRSAIDSLALSSTAMAEVSRLLVASGCATVSLLKK